MQNNPNAADNLQPAQPGEVRNPKGRGKGVPNTKTRLIRLLNLTENLKNPITQEVEGFTVAEQLDLAQIIRARKGDTRAYTAIMDRLEGKPAQHLDHTITTNPVDKILGKFDIEDGEIDAGQTPEA